jgi:ATP-dependent Clp protease protease subunit
MDYFMYTVNVDSDEPIMLINKHIGYDEADGYGIMGDLFQAELLALDQMEKKRIQVWINSPGGSVMDGYNMYTAMLKTKTKVDTYCVGICASMAAVLFQAGRRRYMADYGVLMYHNPFGGSDDKTLNAMKDSLVKMICTRSGMAEEEMGKMMDRTTWIPASEALTKGLCDEIEVSSEQNKKRMPATTDTKAMWKEATKIVNSLLPQKIDMKNVANKLGLNPEASEGAIVESISTLQNKANTAEAKVVDLQKVHNEALKAKDDAIKAKEDELEKLQDSLKTTQDELAKMKTEKEASDKAAKESADNAKAVQAKAMVEGFAKLGKIKNDEATIKAWTDKAVADHDGVKKMLEEIPVNKISNKITGTQNDGQPVGYTAVGAMADVQAKHAKK